MPNAMKQQGAARSQRPAALLAQLFNNKVNRRSANQCALHIHTRTVGGTKRQGEARKTDVLSGANAANLLNMSEQVPAKIVILTDGVPRKVKLDRLVIDFRRASPRNLVGAGRPAGLVVQALRSLRSTGITGDVIAKLRRELKRADKTELDELVPHLPAWMRPIVQEVAK